ncbi:C40 family peptidase [Aureisphaera sp. CAU 1614]|uniref:C40 family peptidase n=1 Tax=Halomarinibacterium sedimenti TaxID=2857106 RepID=A0A9X1FMX8_9FLAO|nr:C40 family peptidase [Halomarinibacterium sedimenti]MBW2936839.1 C40 family peptidase [Halomarinibacterium sedimenti]
MKNLTLLVFIAILVSSCGSSRKPTNTTIIGDTSVSVTAKKATKIVDFAKKFEGTRYKFGGTDKRGMDCSGLVYISFKEENIALPRVSRDMATKGIPIDLNETSEGDLLFFQTNKNRRVINHVGLVIESKKGEILFIHSTSSRGVIVSSLEEDYWKDAFVEVRRII